MIQKSQNQKIYIQSCGGPLIKQVAQNRMVWCKRCGEAVGIFDMAAQRYHKDGNYCKICGAKIEI